MHHINQDIQNNHQNLAGTIAVEAPTRKNGVRLGEQGGHLLSHVHRGEEVARGDYGLHEGTPQVRSQVS